MAFLSLNQKKGPLSGAFFFEIGSLLAQKDEWQKGDGVHILMENEAFRRGRPFLMVYPFSLTITDQKL